MNKKSIWTLPIERSPSSLASFFNKEDPSETMRECFRKLSQEYDDDKSHIVFATQQEHSSFWIEAIQSLLDAGINPNIPPSENGLTPLLDACQYAPSLVLPLLRAGADPNAHVTLNTGEKDGGGDYDLTPLTAAVTTSNLENVRHMLKHGALVDTKDKKGRTALTWAVLASDDPEIVRELLIHGADWLAPMRSGLTPYAIAEQNDLPAENREIFRIIKSHADKLALKKVTTPSNNQEDPVRQRLL